MMLNTANVLMDCDFDSANSDGDTATVVERHYTGFRNISWDPDLEVWFAQTGMIIVFLNTR